MIQALLIGLYLVAIIAANLTVAMVGPNITIINAFIFIGLDLTTRDRLHQLWHHKGLVWKMGALIATGSVLSYLLNAGSGQIALASFVAFALSALVDTTVFSWLSGKAWFVRSNGSNLASAAVDSVVFPVLAFGASAFLPWIILGQFTAKVLGGLCWSVVLAYRKNRSLRVIEE